ncbi:MAG: starch synthase [candidate division Zixibacteria bacterium RBG_16_53_22]|nr:MAG: starch synthase [candidate division Zixibacteria bacterium RBG_16_53_22]
MHSFKILLVSPEAVPFAKTGGLADVAGALPKALKALGHDIRLAMPLYRQIDKSKYFLREVDSNLSAEAAGRKESFALYEDGRQGRAFDTWFVSHPGFFDRPELYKDPSTGQDYIDNEERFAFLARAVLESCRATDFMPDIVHCNDWQSGLIPAFMKVDPRFPEFREIATLLSIHNIGYQGNFPATSFQILGLDDSLFQPDQGFEYWGMVSFLKAGIWYSDIINTVSKRYAQEIQTSNEFGYGFEGILRDRAGDLFGVLNGIDYDVWNPAKDELIPAKFKPEKLEGKAKCKNALRRKTKLPMVRKDVPIIGIISRLADQKGFDLLAEVADDILALDLQMVILGTGDKKYHDLFIELQAKYPKKLSVTLGFDNELAHLIEAGSDMFLMPSRYEPCGLNQMYSLKYGTIPIVRETGGLADTIENVNPARGTGNGFVFRKYDSREMLNAVKFALEVYRNKAVWQEIMVRAMRQDFSWEKSAGEYVELYRKAIAKSGRGAQVAG